MDLETVKQTRLGKDYSSETDEALKLRLYKLILHKYADAINEKEKRTVGEIKQLVTKDDLTIQSILQDFLEWGYDFRKDYLETAKKVFNFVSSEISFVEAGLNINFWLSPKEIFSAKLADDEDLAVFLCSLLYSLGDEQAEVVVAELENLKTHAFVLTQFNNSFYMLDPAQGHDFSLFAGTMEECLEKYYFQELKIKKLLYRFNHSKYEQFL